LADERDETKSYPHWKHGHYREDCGFCWLGVYHSEALHRVSLERRKNPHRGQTDLFGPEPELPRGFHRYVGRCRSCGTGVQAYLKGVKAKAYMEDASGLMGQEHYPRDYGDGTRAHARCPACSKWVTVRKIDGVYRARVPCNVKCWAATGHKCECSCGGKNHGKANAAIGR
jgi:hypothetical protein